MLPRISCFSTGGPAVGALMGSSCWKWQSSVHVFSITLLACNLFQWSHWSCAYFLAVFNQQMYFAMFHGLWLGSFFFHLPFKCHRVKPLDRIVLINSPDSSCTAAAPPSASTLALVSGQSAEPFGSPAEVESRTGGQQALRVTAGAEVGVWFQGR